MRVIVIIITIIMNFVLQSTLLHHISIFNVIPNTSLIIVVCFALLRGRKTGSIIGVFTGLLHDIIFCDVLGIYTLIYFIIGYIVGIFDKKVFEGSVLAVIFFTGSSTVFFHTVYYFIMFFIYVNLNFYTIFKQVILAECIYNCIISIFIYRQLSKIYVNKTSARYMYNKSR